MSKAVGAAVAQAEATGKFYHADFSAIKHDVCTRAVPENDALYHRWRFPGQGVMKKPLVLSLGLDQDTTLISSDSG